MKFWGAILEHFGIQGNSKSVPCRDIFGKNDVLGGVGKMRGSVPEPTWARNGAENAPKRPKDRILWIFEGFGTNLGKIFHDFHMIVAMRLYNFLHVFEQNRNNIFCNLFKNATPQPHKSTNHFSKTLARRNARSD